MLRSAIAALAVACFAMPARAEPPASVAPPVCNSPEAIAANSGATYVALDGAQAQALLDIVNAVEPVTDIKSEHIGLMLFPAIKKAQVGIDDDRCGHIKGSSVLPLEFAMKAYAQVRGQPI